MKFRLLALLFLVACGSVFAVSPKFQSVVKARIENGYAYLLYADGRKGMVPVASLAPDDKDWLTALCVQSPLARGNSTVVVVSEAKQVHKTIQVSKTEGTLETVQLIPPNAFRDQLDATCMLYARVHWLDIAGFYVKTVDLYKIINNSNPKTPWTDPFYLRSTYQLPALFNPRPWVHGLPPQADPFTWARDELRKGRPVLAAFPREIWQDLPPGFIADHPWSGGSLGHQVVLNGFTWDSATRQGTFHVVNSWKELPEFDLKTEAATGAMLVQMSVSPAGEVEPPAEPVVITKVTLLSTIGKTRLYQVDTNQGVQKVAAPDEESARDMVLSAR